MNPSVAHPAHAPGRGFGMTVHPDGWGVLLALDGRCLERLALPRAVELCRGGSRRLDILLVHPPRAAITLLGSFLMALEGQGIDYRLTSSDKDLHEELVHYLRRFQNVSVILLDCQENWDEDHLDTLDALRAEGYRIISLLDHRQRHVVRLADCREEVA